jgi:predicted extracellular nuclease
VRTGFVGTDAIKQAFIYKRATVRPDGAPATLTSAVDPEFDTTRNRPALAQTFQERSSGEKVTVAVNHFKSKGSSCGSGDDANDGSGNCDGTRTRAAQALSRWLATDPTRSGDPDMLIIGDLNAYRNERPISALRADGLRRPRAAVPR